MTATRIEYTISDINCVETKISYDSKSPDSITILKFIPNHNPIRIDIDMKDWRDIDMCASRIIDQIKEDRCVIRLSNQNDK